MINDNDDDNNIDNNNNNNSSKNNNDSNNNNNNNNKYMWVNIKMKPYCLKYRKNTENITPRVSKTSNGRTILLSKCAICGSKKSKFIKNQETLGDPLQKTKKEFKNLKKQEIQTIFTK